MKKTYVTKKSDLDPKWHVIDVDGEVLGRVAVEVSRLLVGKDKVNYSPYLNCGDKVVVINSKKVVLTGNKEQDKVYYRHSGMVGRLKKRSVKQLREHTPNKIIHSAVKGMLPKNRLRSERLANLYIYKGSEHPHTAQVKSNKN